MVEVLSDTYTTSQVLVGAKLRFMPFYLKRFRVVESLVVLRFQDLCSLSRKENDTGDKLICYFDPDLDRSYTVSRNGVQEHLKLQSLVLYLYGAFVPVARLNHTQHYLCWLEEKGLMPLSCPSKRIIVLMCLTGFYQVMGLQIAF